MPILINVNQLEPGMCLARNVVNKFSMLLSRGHDLSETEIASLQKRFPDMQVEVTDPVLDHVVEFQDNQQNAEVSQRIRHRVIDLTRKAGQTVRSGADLTKDQVAEIQGMIREIIAYLLQNPVTSAILDRVSQTGEYFQEHCGNVFYLSMLVGTTIRNYIKREREQFSAAKSLSGGMNLKSLGMAGVLFDIGMIELEHLYKKKGSLSDDEILKIKMHPIKGAEMLGESIDPMSRLTIRCHHENHDGSGYPEGMMGDQIPVFARIIRIADAYCAATSEKAYHKAKDPIQTLYEMVEGPFKNLYDPVIMKVFASIVQPIPIGAKLKLNNGYYGVVVRHNTRDPFKPKIIIAYNEQGKPLSSKELRKPFLLADREDIELVSWGQVDLQFLNGSTYESHTSKTEQENLADECLAMFDLMYP
ncbi:MAG: HD domain-containing protein [Planctomycetes bacterium]|nr:HD domain-containing protein [Planctomycetota bacterium]